MGQFKNKFEEFQEDEHDPDERYQMAYKRVKRIQGFYVHLLVYLIVNAFIISANFYENANSNFQFWNWETFFTPLFWGIGLAAHAVSVFGRTIFFNKGWEERKIKQFMEEESNQKWH